MERRENIEKRFKKRCGDDRVNSCQRRTDDVFVSLTIV